MTIRDLNEEEIVQSGQHMRLTHSTEEMDALALASKVGRVTHLKVCCEGRSHSAVSRVILIRVDGALAALYTGVTTTEWQYAKKHMMNTC